MISSLTILKSEDLTEIITWETHLIKKKTNFMLSVYLDVFLDIVYPKVSVIYIKWLSYHTNFLIIQHFKSFEQRIKGIVL